MFVETSGDIFVHFKGQIFDDVLNALGRDRRLLRASHGHVEEDQELLEGGLIHHVDHAHLYDQEIHDTSSVHR